MTEKLEVVFGKRLQQIPEMAEAVKLAREQPAKVARVVTAYREMITMMNWMVNTPDWQEIEAINQVYRDEARRKKQERGEPIDKIPNDGQNIFLKKLGVERLTEVKDFLNNEFAGSEEGRRAADVMCQMMENAHQKAVKDPAWKPVDGNSDADEVIWGQVALDRMTASNRERNRPTFETDEAKVALAVGHFISQVIYQKFEPKPGEKWEKDDFLSLTDMMAYVATKYSAYISSDLRELIHSWYLAKPSDLGWISDNRMDATDKVMRRRSED